MAPRVQVQGLGGPERLQASANPGGAHIEQAYTGEAGHWSNLARQLDSLEPGLNQLADTFAAQDKDAARHYAESVQVSELNAQLKAGHTFPNQSPVFMAALQNINATQQRAEFDRDLTDRIATGKVSFATPEELDEYIVDARNGFLGEGASEYAQHGWDKDGADMRQRYLDGINKRQSAEFVAKGIEQTTGQITQDVQKLDVANVEPQVAAGQILERIDYYKTTGLLLTPEARKAIYGTAAAELAQRGSPDHLAAFLNAQTDPNDPHAPTIGTAIGVEATWKVRATADREFNQLENKRIDRELYPFQKSAIEGRLDTNKLFDFYEQNKDRMSTSTLISLQQQDMAARQRVATAQNRYVAQANHQKAVDNEIWHAGQQIAAGNPGYVRDATVPAEDGIGTKTIKRDELIQQAADAKVAQSPDMTPQDRAKWYSTAGAEWREGGALVSGAASSITRIAYETSEDGRTVVKGTLPESAKQGIETYRMTKEINGFNAEQTLGLSREQVDLLEDVDSLLDHGYSSDEASAIALNAYANRRNPTMRDAEFAKGIAKAVTEASTTGFIFTDANGANRSFVNTEVTRLATLYLRAGAASDPLSAAKMAGERLSKNYVAVAGGMFPRSALPKLPGADVNPEAATLAVSDFINELEVASFRKKDTSSLAVMPNGGFMLIDRETGMPVSSDGTPVLVTRALIQESASRIANGRAQKYIDRQTATRTIVGMNKARGRNLLDQLPAGKDQLGVDWRDQ